MLAGVQRIVAATSATLTWQGVDQDGEPTDPGTVTVGVVRSDGSTVLTAGTPTSGTGTAPRTVGLTPSQTALLDVLTASWAVGGLTVATTRHEVVGGVYASLAEIRGVETSLADAGLDNRATLLRARDEVAAMFEQSCRQAFVPRFSVVQAYDRWPSVTNLRAVRWVEWIDEWGTVTTGTPSEFGHGISTPWARNQSVRAGVEHGMDVPPADLKRAAIAAIRHQVNQHKSGLDARAMTFQPIDGGNVTLATPGLSIWVTGIPAVDEVLKRYRIVEPAGQIRVQSTSGGYVGRAATWDWI